MDVFLEENKLRWCRDRTRRSRYESDEILIASDGVSCAEIIIRIADEIGAALSGTRTMLRTSGTVIENQPSGIAYRLGRLLCRVESDALSLWNDNDAEPVFFSVRLRTGGEQERRRGREEADKRWTTRSASLLIEWRRSRLRDGDIFARAVTLVSVNKPPVHR